MNISGTTVIVVNGKPTRVCGSRFNQALRTFRPAGPAFELQVFLPTGERIVPSKGLSWLEVASGIRAGKKVVAKVA